MLLRKFFRTIGVYKAQFISMIIMIAIGTGTFIGFNMEWKSIEVNTNHFFEETHFADFRIIDEKGFDKEDIDKIPGAERAGRYFAANVEVNNHQHDAISLTVTENDGVSDFIVTDGDPYDAKREDGIWLSDKYAAENDIKTGDSFSFKYQGKVIDTKVAGLIKSGEYMICLRDSAQVLPDYRVFGYGYISPAMYEKEISYPVYPQINVLSDLNKKEFSDGVDKAFGRTMMILGKDENVSYTGSRGEMEEGKTMASVLPAIFLAIAVLTMITTMHRITAKEKVQIGILKALGFKDKKILKSYMSYPILTGLLGIIPGLVLGYCIAAYIMDPEGNMMSIYVDMTTWDIVMPGFCYTVLVILIFVLAVVGYFSTKMMLKGTAAETLAPYVPETVKHMKIENSKIFIKRSFGTKWNFRDLMRHRIRLVMSLFGVFGCMIIMVCAFGMRDTMDYFLDDYYNGMVNYESRIYIEQSATDEEIDNIKELYGGVYSSEEIVKLKGHPVALEVYETGDGMITLSGEEGNIKKLSDDGAYICTRIADNYNLEVGDKVTVERYNSDKKYTFKIEGIIRNLTEGIILSPEYAEKENVEYRIDSVYSDIKEDEIKKNSTISSVKSKNSIVQSFDLMLTMMNTMVFVLVTAGVILAIIVLYNLGTMSYMERYRELATLKVLGFKDKQIGSLLTEQNIWITVVGTLPGIPLGYVILRYLVKLLAAEYEMKTVISLPTYIICIGISFGVSLIVSFMLSRKNTKIDMVEALKDVE